MSYRYQHLLSPVQIGNVIIKNRTMYPNASPHFLQGPETFPAEGYLTFVTNLAKNGAAIISLAEWNNPDQRSARSEDGKRMQSFDLSDPSVHNYFSQMADDVHFYGSKLLLSTDISMPEGYSLHGGAGFGPMGGGTPRKPLPKEMMPEVYETFVQKLKMYRDFGYDGLEMRVEMNLTAMPSERDDEYAGSLQNRTRFLLDCMRYVKKAMGRDFIIELCIAGEQPQGYIGGMTGYRLEDSIEFALLAEDCVDILQIREADMTKSHPTGFTFKKGEHEVIRYAEAIKNAGCKMLLEPIGGFQDPEELDRYIAEGKCDMIGMARAFMCDPEYGKKLYEGRGEDITPCLWCNKCHGTMTAPWLSFCSVNPLMGIAHKVQRMVDEVGASKKVAVIGGGPAGMRAAIVAAERGHSVTLYEKSDTLGGQLIHGDFSSFKWPIGEYKSWLIRSLGKAGVNVVMNTAPTRDMIESGGYDAILAATGAEPSIPAIDGLKDENGTLKSEYLTCLEVYGRESELGKSVIIVGGSETGTETGMYLAENGHDVTILTRQNELAKDASHLHYITMAFLGEGPDGRVGMRPAWEKYMNLKGILNAATVKVDGGKVTYSDESGEHAIEADSVVICGGMTPRQGQALQFAGITSKFFVIGDANGAGNLQRCNRDAFSKASQI